MNMYVSEEKENIEIYIIDNEQLPCLGTGAVKYYHCPQHSN